jgi:hypothetical protein
MVCWITHQGFFLFENVWHSFGAGILVDEFLGCWLF